jgi:hypothetical protein
MFSEISKAASILGKIPSWNLKDSHILRNPSVHICSIHLNDIPYLGENSASLGYRLIAILVKDQNLLYSTIQQEGGIRPVFGKNGEICMKDHNGNFVSFSGECTLKIYHIPHSIDESNLRILIAEILLHSSEIYSHFITSANQSSLLNYLIPASKFTRSDIGKNFSRNFKVIIKFSTIENSQNLANSNSLAESIESKLEEIRKSEAYLWNFPL